MKPNAIESLLGLQAALIETIVPELQTMFAQDTANVLQMLIESVAGEWDTAAEDARRDNTTMVTLLGLARDAIGSLPERNEELASLVSEIRETLAEPEPGSIVLSALGARRTRLSGVLERTVCALEDRAADAEFAALLPVRTAIYDHLREVSMRGWAFWDMASFREMITRLRATPAA